MKKKLLIQFVTASFICILAASCASPKPAYESIVTYIDYRAITSQTGVYLTEATSITESYEGLGSVTAVVQDGYKITNITQPNDTIFDSIYGQTVIKKKSKVKYGNYINATPIEAVRLAANKAKSMGANGIINLKITTIPGERTSYIVTGMAVKSK